MRGIHPRPISNNEIPSSQSVTGALYYDSGFDPRLHMREQLHNFVLRRKVIDRRGQAAVEFALVLIVAMIVLFVSIQMAMIGQAALALGQMNYQGARYAAVNSSLGCDAVALYMSQVGSPTITKNGVSCGTGYGVTVTMTCSGTSCPPSRTFGTPVQIALSFSTAGVIFLSTNTTSPSFLGIPFPTALTSTETAMTE